MFMQAIIWNGSLKVNIQYYGRKVKNQIFA